MAPDTRAYGIAQVILNCALDALTDTIGGQPPRACVITGAIAWDNCECGQLIVSLTSSYPSSNFPTPAANTATQFGAGRCGQPVTVYGLTISMLRCVPISDDQGNPPTCEALGEAALVAVQDASAIRDGVLCCLSSMLREKDDAGTPVITGFAVQNQDFTGAQGMCGGSQMTLQFGLLNYCPCAD